MESNKEIITLRGHEDRISCLAFNSNEKIFASGSDNTIKLWDLELLKEIKTFKEHDK